MNIFSKLAVTFALLTTAAFAQPTYPFTFSPNTFSVNVDKFAVNPVVQVSTPIVVTLASGVTGNHLINVSVPPFTDINGNINSAMFGFVMNDGFNIYTGHQALVNTGGQTQIFLTVDVSKLAATVSGFPLGVPVFIQDGSTGLTQSAYINLSIVDGRTYLYPDANARVLPHFASGVGWNTVIQLTNQNGSNSQVRIDFYDQHGNPVNTRLADGRFQADIWVDINAHGTTSITLADATVNYTIVGSARVTPTIGYPVGITEIINTPAPNAHAVGLPAQLVNTDSITFFYDATNGNTLGLALLNSLNYAEPLTLTYYDNNGNLLKTTTETLGALSQIARTLDKTAVPEIQGKTGTITASFPPGVKALNGIALKFDPSFYFIPITPITNTVN